MNIIFEDTSREWSKLHPDMYSAKYFMQKQFLNLHKGKIKMNYLLIKSTS